MPTSPDIRSAAPLGPLLMVTCLQSIATGVFWNAIAFITKHGYGFRETENLLLYAVMGAVYTLGAWRSGRVIRAVRPWLRPRALLILLMVVQSAACVLPAVTDGAWAIWCAAIVVSSGASLLWPTVESYLSAGRHGPSMRSAIGSFNLVWMASVAAPLFAMAPVIEANAPLVVAAQAVVNLLTIVPLLALPESPGTHDVETAASHRTKSYPNLLRSSRVLLLLSYVLNAAMSPILPYRFEAIGTNVAWETPATATWMVVRIGAVVIMWLTGFWHGRWGTLLLGAVTMAGGFGLVVLAPALPPMLAGFALFGIGVGMIYYAGLYYALSVGHAEVEAGGAHEAFIGSGYTIGPVAGLCGVAAAGGLGVASAPMIVAIVLGIMALSAPLAVRPYLAARKNG